MAAMKDKQYQEALELFSEAVSHGDTESDVHLGMAICFLELGNWKKQNKFARKC